MKKMRVTIPRHSPAEILELAAKVLTKHQEGGQESLVKSLDWENLTRQIEEGIHFHQQAELHRLESQRHYQDRDLRLESILDGLRNIRDILTGCHKANMKALNEWGYEVIEAPKKVNKENDNTNTENEGN